MPKTLREKSIEKVKSFFGYIKDQQEKIPYWNRREVKHSPIIRYGVVILLCIIVFLIKNTAGPLLGTIPPFMLFYAVIMISSWYGGLYPGIVSVILSSFFAYHFYNVAAAPSVLNVVVIFTIFIIEGLFMTALGNAMHRAVRNYEEKKEYIQYYARIASTISDAVISTDMENHIQSWNHGAEALYGFTEEEVMGKLLTDIVPEIYVHEQKHEIDSELFLKGEWKGELINKRRNGSRVSILTSISIIYDENKKPLGIVHVNKDISDRKKLEQGKDDFIALASHELKTPLTSVKLYAGILTKRIESIRDKASAEYLSKINIQIEKLLELVNHLLDVSKVQAGKIQFHFEEFLIDTFVKEVVRDIQQITPSHSLVIQGETRALVSIDKDRLRQVLINILNNAIKYSAHADTVIITLSLRNKDKEVEVRIKDFGVGIPREKRDKIFDRFYQVTDSKGYTYAGMGLGLYISREIIEKHQGALKVESKENKGSEFFFTLPIIKKHIHAHPKNNSSRR